MINQSLSMFGYKKDYPPLNLILYLKFEGGIFLIESLKFQLDMKLFNNFFNFAVSDVELLRNSN